MVEYLHLKDEKDFFKFEKIEKIEPNFLDNLSSYFRKRYYVNKINIIS